VFTDAATEVFARRGFEGASLEEIAESAGYSRGALSKHFASKEELFLAVLDRRIEKQLEMFSDAIDREGPDWARDPDKQAEVWQQILTEMGDWTTLDLEFRLYAMRSPEARTRLIAHERAFQEVLARFIETTSSALGITLNLPAPRLAAIIVPAVQGLNQFSYLDPDQVDLFPDFFRLLMGSVVGEREALVPGRSSPGNT
jgi:AcrR family transcriptional regulator